MLNVIRLVVSIEPLVAKHAASTGFPVSQLNDRVSVFRDVKSLGANDVTQPENRAKIKY